MLWFSARSPSLVLNSLGTQKCDLCKNNKQVPLGMHDLKFPFSLSCLLLITNEIISAYALQVWLKYQTLFIKYVTLKHMIKCLKNLLVLLFLYIL